MGVADARQAKDRSADTDFMVVRERDAGEVTRAWAAIGGYNPNLGHLESQAAFSAPIFQLAPPSHHPVFMSTILSFKSQ